MTSRGSSALRIDLTVQYRGRITLDTTAVVTKGIWSVFFLQHIQTQLGIWGLDRPEPQTFWLQVSVLRLDQ